jgi:hypothetical protein
MLAQAPPLLLELVLLEGVQRANVPTWDVVPETVCAAAFWAYPESGFHAPPTYVATRRADGACPPSAMPW